MLDPNGEVMRLHHRRLGAHRHKKSCAENNQSSKRLIHLKISELSTELFRLFVDKGSFSTPRPEILFYSSDQAISRT
jgi:hypothetical protein